MKVLVKELYKVDTQAYDYEVQDVVFCDVKEIKQNPHGGVTLIMETGDYTSIGASDYHFIQIF